MSSSTVIGEGTFGQVRKETGPYGPGGQQITVAVKRLRHKQHPRSFLKEISMLRKLNNHENIIKLLHASENGQLIVLEYVQYDLLKQLTYYRVKLGEDKIAELAKNIMEGMAYIHGNRVVHCDIKCGNILVEGDFRTVKICDFGMATELPKGVNYQRTSRLLGTPDYAAPEIFPKEVTEGGRIVQKNGKNGYAQDCFSLGITLFLVSFGYNHPFRSPGKRWEAKEWPMSINGGIRWPFGHGYDPNNPLHTLIEGLLRYDPATRLSLREAMQHPFITNRYSRKHKVPGDGGQPVPEAALQPDEYVKQLPKVDFVLHPGKSNQARPSQPGASDQERASSRYGSDGYTVESVERGISGLSVSGSASKPPKRSYAHSSSSPEPQSSAAKKSKK